MSSAPTLVDDSAKRCEQLWNAVDLIQNNQAAFVLAEKEHRLCELLTIFPCFQVEIECSGAGIGDTPCECGLPCLPGPEQCHSSLVLESFLDSRCNGPGDHPC